MKVVVLGGAGDMGSEAVRDLLHYPEVKKVTIADLNTDAAAKLVASLNGDPRLQIRPVDAASPENLAAVLEGHTVAAGALGPFYRFEKPIVEAVLKVGLDYVSICDDYDAAEAVLTYDREARERGCKIITGLGWTPGLSNLLARKGYQELEEVVSVKIYWAGSAADSTGLAVILHTIHIFRGLALSFEGGQPKPVKAGSGEEVVEFPAPLGQVHTFYVGHPEPVTIPRYLPGVSEVTLKGGLVENYLNHLTRFIGATKLAAAPQGIGRLMKRILPLFPADKKRSLSGIRVDVYGRKKGKNIKLSYMAADHMRRLTGIPLSIGAYLLGKGEIERRGVYGPEAEGGIDPHRLLEELAQREVHIRREEEQA